MKSKVNLQAIMNDERLGEKDGKEEFLQDQQEYLQYERRRQVSFALRHLKRLSAERRQEEKSVGDLRKHFFQTLMKEKSSKYFQNLDSLDKEDSDLLYQQFFPYR